MQAAKRNSEGEKFRQLKTAHKLHVRKADVFNMHLVEVTEKAIAEGLPETMVIVMDFQKICLCPKLAYHKNTTNDSYGCTTFAYMTISITELKCFCMLNITLERAQIKLFHA